MTTSDDLIAYWSLLDYSKPPYVHPEDKGVRGENGVALQIGKALRLPDDACYETPKDRGRFHVNLLPVPYVGDLKKATVFILMLNPGCGPVDYVAESDAAYRQAMIDQLSQSFEGKRPFFYLRPEFSWTGGGQWWRNKLKPVIERFVAKGWSVSGALDSIAARVAVLEYWPYHSVSANLHSSLLKESKSHRMVSSFALSELTAKAGRKECLVIVARAVQRWGVLEGPSIVLYSPVEARQASLRRHADTMYEFIVR